MATKVSIIIPTYKRGDRVGEAVKSALAQSYENFEVIVVDDNDPDTEERKVTEKNLKKFKGNKNFKYIQHDENKNGSAARNTGIRNSTGDYITFLDDDDEYYPNKISLQAQVLDKLNEDWGLVYTGYEKIDQYGNVQYSGEKSEGDILVQVLTKNLFIGSGSNFMIRRKLVQKLNGFDETFKRNQDLEFLARALMYSKIKYLDTSTFLIHNEIRDEVFLYEEIKGINRQYKKKFESFISKLTEDEQDEIYITLSLLDIRTALSYRHISEALIIYMRSSVKISDLFKYFKYLVRRYIKKKSYGFKLYG